MGYSATNDGRRLERRRTAAPARLFFGMTFCLFPILLLAGCAELTLAWADLEPNGDAARPPILEESVPDESAAGESAVDEKPVPETISAEGASNGTQQSDPESDPASSIGRGLGRDGARDGGGGDDASRPRAKPVGDRAVGDPSPAGDWTVARWETTRAPRLRKLLQDHVYGRLPDGAETRVLDKTLLDAEAFGGRGRLEQWRLRVEAAFGGVRGAGDFTVRIVTPTGEAASRPVILMETFCPPWDAMPHPRIPRPEGEGSMGGSIVGRLGRYFFGRYICTPPFADILDAGYGVAMVYPHAVLPDNREQGAAALRRLSAGHDDDATRWGAIGAWGWLFSRVVDALEDDARFASTPVIAWGHSRYAKAALVAAAFDARIDGVIAHQSGTGGASLNRRKKGESVASITKTYPHWFSRAYAAYAGREEEMPVDQHMLLALIAPRPLFLGNARRDVWSDPNGAFRAAMGADPVYELYSAYGGAAGLDQAGLRPYKPAARVAFWMRPGTHGVVEEDWPAFLEFMDAHFGPGAQFGDRPAISK